LALDRLRNQRQSKPIKGHQNQKPGASIHKFLIRASTDYRGERIGLNLRSASEFEILSARRLILGRSRLGQFPPYYMPRPEPALSRFTVTPRNREPGTESKTAPDKNGAPPSPA